jgi:ABC-type uncharacterized transport system involved in gliding motility auxiliary subunit
MNDQLQPEPTNQEPLIPSWLLLGAALLGLIVAFGVAFTQGNSIIIITALAISLASIAAWALFSPQEFRGFITGRGVRFGGLSIVVTVVFIAALIGIYSVVKAQNWRADLTEQDTFSLTQASRDAMVALGADPNIPPVEILAFYGVTEASRRDQDQLLFEDYVDAGNGKITYEFIDPEREPVLAEQLGVSAGQVAVVGHNQDGTRDLAGAQIIDLVTQEQLSNAILRVAATGDFRAYVLSVEEGATVEDTGGEGFSEISTVLSDQLDWTVEQIALTDLISGQVDLSDPLINGSVLIIPGGATAIPDEGLAAISDFLSRGGDALIFAATNFEGEPSLATSESFNNYLSTNYGLNFSSDVVLDADQAFQGSPFEFFTFDYVQGNSITQAFDTVQDPAFVFNYAHPIEATDALPENVTVTGLINSSATSFAKPIDAVIDGQTEQAETDPVGPFLLAAASENAQTGSRVVLVGSQDFATNRFLGFRAFNVLNIDMTVSTVIWATNFEDFFTRVPPALTRETRPQDTPIFASPQTLTTINLVTVFALPFGVLLLGFFVWSSRRAETRKGL